MSRMAAIVVDRVLRNNNGVVDGQGRIFNVDTGTYELGYTQINTHATSTFSPIKTHKGWFSGTATIRDGDLIQDRVDGRFYLAISLKKEVTSGVTAYIDGTLYFANMICKIERFNKAGPKDAFGRPTSAAPELEADDVHIMVQSVSIDVVEQPDQIMPKEKIKVAIQAKHNIQVNDRLHTSGDIYRVVSIDKSQFTENSLVMLYVDKDIR